MVELRRRCSFVCCEEERKHCRWKVLVRKHPELASADHGGGEVHHQWVRLQVQIAQHFVRPPAANELDNIGVDLAAEEGHGAASA